MRQSDEARARQRRNKRLARFCGGAVRAKEGLRARAVRVMRARRSFTA